MTSTPSKIWAGLSLIALGILTVFVVGCGIVETDQPELGALTVNAWDSTQGELMIGGEILLDGIPRQERTPATISGLHNGSFQVAVHPPDLTYPTVDTTVMVTAPETNTITLTTGRSGAPGWLNVDTSVFGCDIIVDGRLMHSMPPTLIDLLAGIHKVSVFHPSNTLPELGFVMVEVRSTDTTHVTLDLVAGEPGIEQGQLAPNLFLTGDLGDEYTVGQFRGCVLLLNFAGFRCDPCLRELPVIQDVYEEEYAAGFRVLVINVGWWNEDASDFAALREDLQLSMPLLFPDSGDDNATMIYDIQFAPTNILIDRCGIIQARFGETTYDDLIDRVALLL